MRKKEMEKAWLDTFTRNAAFVKHSATLIAAMDEKLKDDSDYDAETQRIVKERRMSYCNTIRMLLNLKPNTNV